MDAIRRSRRFTDQELLALAAGRDDGFDRMVYAAQLRQVGRIRDDRFEDYGLNSDEIGALRARTRLWADTIDGVSANEGR